MKKAFGIGALVLTLAGCDNQLKNYNTYVDLNNDKKQEIVTGGYGKSHLNYVDYNLTAKISNSEGIYSEPKLLMRFKESPKQINFTDLDGDGDLDLVFSEIGKSHLTYVNYDTFVAKNDGEGNFSEPRLINRKKK